jgi:hypothetical protein
VTELNPALAAEELDALEDFLAQPELEVRSLIKPASRYVPKPPPAPTCPQPYATSLGCGAVGAPGTVFGQNRRWAQPVAPTAMAWPAVAGSVGLVNGRFQRQRTGALDRLQTSNLNHRAGYTQHPCFWFSVSPKIGTAPSF